jgi:hypothetical protein
VTDDVKKALVRGSPTALVRTGSKGLTTRGLLEIESAERAETSRQWKLISEMSPEEVRKSLLTSNATGLPNLRAFAETERNSGPAPVVAISNLDGLEAFRDTFGPTARNALQRGKADALRKAGLDAYHDEDHLRDMYLFRGESPEELRTKLEKARTILRGIQFEVADSGGAKRTAQGADFQYAIGRDLAEAEENLALKKGWGWGGPGWGKYGREAD